MDRVVGAIFDQERQEGEDAADEECDDEEVDDEEDDEAATHAWGLLDFAVLGAGEAR